MLLLGASAAEAAEEYVDEFTGGTLRPEWRVENEDVMRYGMADDNYLFLSGDMQQKNRIVKSIDGSGDFTIEVVGHGAFGRAANIVYPEWKRFPCFEVGLTFGKGAQIVLATCTNQTRLLKNIGEDWNSVFQNHEGLERFLLRIEKDGVQYRAFAIIDGNELNVGTHFMPQSPTALFLDSWTADPSVPEPGVFIDRVTITPN